MDLRSKTVNLKPNASFRPLGDEGVILMTDSGQLYSTNGTGTVFMTQIAAGASSGDAIDALLEEFDVAEEVLVADLAELVSFLEAEGVVAIADAGA